MATDAFRSPAREVPGSGHVDPVPARPTRTNGVEDGPVDVVDWEALYEELGESVFRLLHRLTGDAQTAEDLTHDTFVKVHQRRHQYAGRGSLHGWVCRIARNLALTHERDRSNRLRLLRREAPALRPGARSPFASSEALLLLEASLDRLPATRRAALILHVVDGYTHKEIGGMLGIAEGTSKAHVSLAKAELRKMLDEEA